MSLKITNDFDKAMKEYIWLDAVTLNELSAEQYKEFLRYTFDLDHHKHLRLYRGNDEDDGLTPGLVTNSEQMDFLISYLSYLRTKM